MEMCSKYTKQILITLNNRDTFLSVTALPNVTNGS